MKMPSFNGGKRSALAVGLVMGMAAAGVVVSGVTSPASAESGRRICGSVWTAPSKHQPEYLFVYIRYAKVKLNSPGCIQVHNDLDHNHFASDYPKENAKYGGDIGRWTRHAFRVTCEDFSAGTLRMPGTDACTTTDLWTDLSPTFYSMLWGGNDSSWQGVR